MKTAYLDWVLCALNADGVPVFSRIQEDSYVPSDRTSSTNSLG